jgi:Excalibur calcium-binding domain/Protein of unknown function (DUF1524)
MAWTRWRRSGQRGGRQWHAQPGGAPVGASGQTRRGLIGTIRAHPVLSSVIGVVTLVIVASGIGSAVGGGNHSADRSPATGPVTTTRATSAHPSLTARATPPSSAGSPSSQAPSRSAARPTQSPTPPSRRAALGTAVAVLATIPLKGRAPKTGYSREQFGQAWSDDVNVPGGHNGCDTRNDILRRDLTDITLKPNTSGCVVATGKLADPYTATLITFVRGAGTSSAVQIDHVVALGDAWQKGAQRLTLQRRTDFANDPLNLLAVSGAANQQKGDGDAATWLPPNKSYRCAYVARQIGVKKKYALWVTAAEQAAMQRILSTCPGKRVPTEGQPPPRVQPTATKPSAATSAPPAPPASSGGDVYYANCAAVRAAGKAPLYRGQPGYRPGLDRDGDGIACE